MTSLSVLHQNKFDSSKRIATTDVKCLKLKKMAKNIISDSDKSSSINKRVREDGTLTKKVDSSNFLIIRSGDYKLSQTAVNQLNHFSEQILIMVQNYTIKAAKCSHCLKTKMTQIHLQNNVPSVKDHLKHREG